MALKGGETFGEHFVRVKMRDSPSFSRRKPPMRFSSSGGGVHAEVTPAKSDSQYGYLRQLRSQINDVNSELRRAKDMQSQSAEGITINISPTKHGQQSPPRIAPRAIRTPSSTVDPLPQTMTGLRNELLDAQATLLKAAEAGENSVEMLCEMLCC
jgi:hypothetical protein